MPWRDHGLAKLLPQHEGVTLNSGGGGGSGESAVVRHKNAVQATGCKGPTVSTPDARHEKCSAVPGVGL